MKARSAVGVLAAGAALAGAIVFVRAKAASALKAISF